jgi:hypothetical protein
MSCPRLGGFALSPSCSLSRLDEAAGNFSLASRLLPSAIVLGRCRLGFWKLARLNRFVL